MREVDADVRDAARAMGLTGLQVFGRVEAPLAAPFVMAGFRTAAIEVVATSTLAAYVSYSDLGTYVISGLDSHDTVEAFCGSVLVAVMAALVALLLGSRPAAPHPGPASPDPPAGDRGPGRRGLIDPAAFIRTGRPTAVAEAGARPASFGGRCLKLDIVDE